jgi:hypothetical protein
MPTNSDLLETIIKQATTLSDQGALRTILVIVERNRGTYRADMWRHFEQHSGRRIRHLVPELHRVFDLVQADKLDVKSDAFDARAYSENVERKRKAATG